MKQITQIITRIALAAALPITAAPFATAHPDWKEKLPRSYAEAFIPMTDQDFKRVRQSRYRHPPGNVRAEDMRALFDNRVVVVDFGRKSSTVGAPQPRPEGDLHWQGRTLSSLRL